MSSATRVPVLRRLRAQLEALTLPAALVVLIVATMGGLLAGAEEARPIPSPAPSATAPPTAAGSESAVLAGGCFWGVQAVFQHLKGVTRVESGYAGGERESAEYEIVSEGNTGHAESVRIEFDPHQISFGELLHVYFSVAHDPTQLNRQGPDSGTQYRSEIFAQSPQQMEMARAYIAQLDAAHAFPRPIVTRVEPHKRFFPAESYHQDFLARNPGNPYIVINDLPKVANLQRLFPELYRTTAVLVYPPH
ncbi:MAG TPA: peptide-methionine (S)-S-oxide reductase MsrA [Steroidobacteraceae bacterium]|jgi:peptide-methionine (S)-S-oxide reductase